MIFRDSIRLAFPRCVGAVLAFIAITAAPAFGDELAVQRDLFKRVYATVERGDWSPVETLSATERNLLERYVLWPDLRATWLRANLKTVPASEVDAFLGRHGTLQPVRELRYRQALHLAQSGELEGFRRIYEQFYQGRGIARLDCLSLQADIAAGRHARVPSRAINLWMVGRSQVEECDPVFAYLSDNNLLGPVEYRKRFGLAIKAREFGIARWLAKSIDQQHIDTASSWQQAQANPARFLEHHNAAANNEIYRQQLVYAAERLTYADADAAHRLWSAVEKRYGFTEEQKLRTRRHIALWTARDNLSAGYYLLASLPAAAQDDEVHRWRARTSLRDSKWQRLLLDIEAMEPTESDREEWQYWRAVALQRTGEAAVAHAAFEALSKERSYYGFLAADEIGAPYALESAVLAADDAALANVASNPRIVRARELFLVGLEGRGRSEWDAAVRTLNKDEQLQAAILADRWGWHSRAISVASGLGEYDDLAMRYPLPWQEQFESYSSAAQINPTWAYGVARSESLFMRDVRSSAGAIGLMQLMPRTGRAVAKKIRLPYSGLATLTDPAANIRLGTSYLGEMAERFDGNPVLATAAYNAGPHRVDQWLPADGAEDARAWIENIPFNETRKYVKRVLAAQTIFHWRMTGQERRLSDSLQTVRSPQASQKVAQR
jgi:soluble lytic murein transglycosylase